MTELVNLITQVAFVSLGLAALINYLHYRNQVRRDTALMFVLVGSVAALQIIRPFFDIPSTLLRFVSILALFAQPYLLIRIVGHFQRVPRSFYIGTFLGMMLSWLILLPTNSTISVLLVVVLYFVPANAYAMWAFIQGALRSRGVVQRRLRFIASGSGLFALSLLWIVVGWVLSVNETVVNVLVQLTASSAAVCFYVGLVTPQWLQQAWQLAELRRFLLEMPQGRSPETVEAVYAALCRGILEATNGNKAYLLLLDETGEQWILYQPPHEFRNLPGAAVDILEPYWQKRSAVAITAPREKQALQTLLPVETAELLYLVPLAYEQRGFGLILVLFEHGSLFINEDLQMIGLFAEQSAIVLENIELSKQIYQYMEQLEKRVEERTATLRQHSDHLALLQQITQAANEATTIHDPIQQAVQLICQVLDLPIGHAFAPVEDAPDKLESTAIWYLADPEKYQPFRQVTEETAYSPKLGGIRQALKHTIPQWFTNLAELPDYSRTEVVRSLGLQTGIFIPILSGREAVAILEFYSEQLQEPNEGLREIFLQIGMELGRVIERKQAEVKIRQSEERFRSTFEQAAVGVAHVSLEGRFLRLNQRFCEIVGYSHDEMLRLTFQDITHPDDLDADLAYVRQTLAGDISYYSMEKRYIHHNGSHKWVNLTVSLVRDESGEATYFIAVVEDIDSRKQVEKELRERKDTLALSLWAAKAGVWTWDIVTDEIIWDEALERIYGLEPGSFAGFYEAWKRLVHPDDFAEAEQGVLDALAGVAPFDTEFRIVWPDGSVRHISGQGLVLRDENDDPVQMIGLNIDITERKEAEEEIRRLNTELEQRVRERTAHLAAVNQELEAFSYSVSHDLRAPLRAVDGFSQALLEDYYDLLDDMGRDFLQRIRKESQRMGYLIDDLINLSRYTRADMNLKTVNLSDMVKDMAAELQANEPARAVEFTIQDDLVARGDESLMRAVLQNLIDNAWKFTSKKTNACIEFGSQKQEDGRAIFYVRDNGAGFNMAYANKLFGAFQRLHAMDEFEGTGIGLATVQRIIHRHGGTVWAESELDQGATFFFTLANGRYKQ